MAQKSVETRQLKLVASTDTFTVTTSRVEEWLQRQLNAATAFERQKQSNNGKDIPSVNITLFTLKASPKFFPFVIMLPEEALIGNRKGKNDEEMAIFNPNDSQSISKFLPHLWSCLSHFMYNNNEKKAFRTNEVRRSLELRANTGNNLSTIVFPRSEFKSGSKFSLMLLDPIRVFYTMVKEDIENEIAQAKHEGRYVSLSKDFHIEIEKVEYNQGTDYTYTFNKVPNTGKRKKKENDIMKDLEKLVQNAATRGV